MMRRLRVFVICMSGLLINEFHFRFHLIKSDEDDNKFVDCAIAANARYIVTEDHHFDVLKSIEFPVVDIIRIDKFVLLLTSL